MENKLMSAKEFIESKGFSTTNKNKTEKSFPASFMLKMMEEYNSYVEDFEVEGDVIEEESDEERMYFSTLDLIELEGSEDTYAPMDLEQAQKEKEIFEKFTQITSLEIHEEYEDDHLPCFKVNIKTDLGVLHLDLAWLNKDGVKAIYSAEEGKFKKLTEWLLEERGE